MISYGVVFRVFRNARAAAVVPLCALAGLVAVVAVFRSPILGDERVWYDEFAVLLDGHAIPHARPWPMTFRRAELYSEPSLASVLRNLARHDAYPPVVPIAVFLGRGASNPIGALRGLHFVLGLMLLPAAYWAARPAGGPWLALLAAAYVATSTHLTHASQQIKWIAVAPVLSTTAACLLLRLKARPRWWVRIAYILCIATLLHVHYFCVWVLAGHLLYVALAARDRLRSQIVDFAASVSLAMPWYATALPTQLRYVGAHFAAVADRAVDAWNAPFGLQVMLRALGYDLLVGVGLLPLPLRGRFLAPLLLLALLLVLGALRSPVTERRRLAWLGVCCLVTGAGGQVVYAARVGNVVPLQALYLCAWYPLLMVAVVVGAAEVRRSSLRVLAVAALVGGSLSTLMLSPIADVIQESHAPSSYSALCREILAVAGTGTGVVFREDMEAKLVNLSCPIAAEQAIGWRGAEALPDSIHRAAVVAVCTSGSPGNGPLWRRLTDGKCVGDRKILLYLRLHSREYAAS